jgi:hypothetical protein
MAPSLVNEKVPSSLETTVVPALMTIRRALERSSREQIEGKEDMLAKLY